MEFVNVKCSELSGWALCFAVALAEDLGEELRWDRSALGEGDWCMWTDNFGHYRPDRDWEIGGPLIDKYCAQLNSCAGNVGWYAWTIKRPCDGDQQYGDSALEAVCRSVVFERFGETARVPKELLPC
jgi:hypothetical protein